MALNLDVSKLTQSAAMKPTAHDNCIVLDLGTGGFPRDIEVRLPDDDGARQNALWDGSLNLAVNDEVLCFEYSGISAWRVMAMGGNDGGAGKARVSEVWESDFGDVALQSDADGNIVIGAAGPAGAALEVFSTTQAQLRLAFGATKYAEFSFDTSHLLTIDTTSVGHILLNATVRIVDDILREGDFDTKIGLADDKISLTAGGLLMFEATEIAGQDTLDLGDVGGAGDVDISFNNGQMFLQGSNGRFGFGTVVPARQVEINSSLPLLKFDGHASGEAHSIGIDANGLVFYNEDDARYDFVIDNAGRIGIGAVAPSRDLQMRKNISSSAGLTFQIFNESTATNSFASMEFQANNGAVNGQFFVDGLGGVIAGGGMVVRTFTNHPMVFGTNQIIALTIDTSQRIGINGVTAPSTELDIGAGAIEGDEMTDPGAGAANTYRLFAEDNGAGKTRLMVRFASGAAQQIAIQP